MSFFKKLDYIVMKNIIVANMVLSLWLDLLSIIF